MSKIYFNTIEVILYPMEKNSHSSTPSLLATLIITIRIILGTITKCLVKILVAMLRLLLSCSLCRRISLIKYPSRLEKITSCFIVTARP